MENSISKLLEDLKSPDETIRRYAAEDLGDLNDTKAIIPLLDALNDTSTSVREAVAESLKIMNGPEVSLETVKLLKNEDVTLRNYAIEILSCLGDAAVSALIENASENTLDAKIFSLKVLGEVSSDKNTKSIEFIHSMVKENNPNIKIAAIEALGKIGSTNSIPLLLDLVNDVDCQFYVVSALIEMRSCTATESLIKLNEKDLNHESKSLLDSFLSEINKRASL